VYKVLSDTVYYTAGYRRCQGSVEFCFAVENVSYSGELAVGTEVVNVAIDTHLICSFAYSNEIEEALAVPVTPVTARKFD
jgi:hypothetical protein